MEERFMLLSEENNEIKRTSGASFTGRGENHKQQVMRSEWRPNNTRDDFLVTEHVLMMGMA
jgi:hypothetical protein